MSAAVKPTGRFHTKAAKARPKVVCDLHFRVHRSGLHPVIEFAPGSGLDDVTELSKPERDQLVEHVTSILRDRAGEQ